ncbi:MaoC/PaaZ C-terminal domain-containing protein [Mycobacterium sp. C31M]
MTLDLDAVGRTGPETVHEWTSKDAMLYALGVGAGQDPGGELEYTTELAPAGQRVLPTMAIAIAMAGSERPDFGDVDRTKLVHAEQSVTIHEELRPNGRVRLQTTITGIRDKRTGALISWRTTGRDASTGQPLFTTEASGFLRGAGGFGGDPGPSTKVLFPERPADDTITMCLRPEQALLYRLSGDRNPLHADPEFAARGGYDRPILHGLCTLGFAARALLGRRSEPKPRLHSLSVRFTQVLYPGDEICVHVWDCGPDEVLFRVLAKNGAAVIDNGSAAFLPSAAQEGDR